MKCSICDSEELKEELCDTCGHVILICKQCYTTHTPEGDDSFVGEPKSDPVDEGLEDAWDNLAEVDGYLEIEFPTEDGEKMFFDKNEWTKAHKNLHRAMDIIQRNEDKRVPIKETEEINPLTWKLCKGCNRESYLLLNGKCPHCNGDTKQNNTIGRCPACDVALTYYDFRDMNYCPECGKELTIPKEK